VVENVKTPKADPSFTTELSRDLGLSHITLMGVGMMIGAGVFVGIGQSLSVVGPGGTILTFALNGIVAMCSAMAYAELSSAIPRAGGAYNFARIGFGRGTSFMAGWMEWFASSMAGSMYALTCATFVLNFMMTMGWLPWNHSPTHVSVKIMAIIVAGFFIYINYRGASETGKAGVIFTFGQMFTLAAVAIGGLVATSLHPERLQNFTPFVQDGNWLGLMATMGFTYVAFEGFEVIAQAGDETIDPRKNLPKAMLLSVLVAVFTYVAVTFAATVAFARDGRWNNIDPKVLFAECVTNLLPFGGVLVVLAVVFSATSALNATTYSATRSVYALGRDRFLPPGLSRISQRRKTPYVALLATSVIIIVATFLPLEDVMASASMTFLFLFFLVNLCAIKIRRHMGDELSYGYVMPLFPLPPLLAIVAQVLLAWHLREISPLALALTPGWLLLGAGVYWLHGRRNVEQSRDEIMTIEEEELRPVEGAYRMLVPVANPDNALNTVPHTMRIAEVKNASVELLHMVPIPDQIPLSDAHRYMEHGKEAIVEAMLYLATRFPVRHTVRYCRNAARGILSAAREHATNLIVVGWRGHTHAHDFFYGSTVDPILERNPCDVVVVKGSIHGGCKRVLVPLAGGPNSRLSLEMASIFVDPEEGKIVPFNVTQPGKPTLDIDKFLEKTQERYHCSPELFEPKFAVNKHPSEAILEEAKNCDLLVIGATDGSVLRQFTGVPLPEAVARQTDIPLIMVKAGTVVKTWVERWL
jgi:APA family basic amino acid/polyamine antiporter